MAKITLTLTDIDVTNGSLSMDLEVYGSTVSKGNYTPAYIVGHFLKLRDSSGALALEAREYAKAQNISILEAESLSTIVLTITDLDIDKGYYNIDLHVADREVPPYYTAALLTAKCICHLVKTDAFVNEMWKYAVMLTSVNKNSRILNESYRMEQDLI